MPVGDVSATAVQPVTGLAGSAAGAIPAQDAILNLEVALQPSAGVRARVVRENGGAPAVGMAVEVTGTSRRFGSTDDQGILRFADLVLGTYQIVVTDPLGDGIARPTVVLDEGGGQVDLGDVVLDEARPTVVSIVPSSGAASVPGTQPIVVTFSDR